MKRTSASARSSSWAEESRATDARPPGASTTPTWLRYSERNIVERASVSDHGAPARNADTAPRLAQAQLARFLGIAKQVASVLDYLAGYELVHRDLSPTNILFGRTGQVKVI